MKTYTFHFPGPCSPKEFRQHLEQRVRGENEAAGKVLKMILKWRPDGQFDLRVNFYSRIDETRVEKGILSFSATTQVVVSATFSEIFRGAVKAETEGGCTVCGRFHHLWWAYGGLFLAFTCPQLLVGVLEGVDLFSPNKFVLWSLIGGAIGIYPFFDFYRHCDNTTGSQWLVSFLEDCAVRWQESLEEGIPERFTIGKAEAGTEG